MVRHGTNGVPAPVSTFIGRADELVEIGKLLLTVRLLTLTGAGGCGKTRLALEAASGALDRFPDGVSFCDLSPFSDPAFVSRAVADVLSVAERPDQPLIDTLAASLRDKRALVVLDNCEHLLGPCAELAHALLTGCPRLAVLATSREHLGVGGECVWRVPSLELPDGDAGDPEALTGYDAIRLFVDRAAHASSGFSLTHDNAPAVVEICRRLDGMPLAIELAAARTRMLMPVQIAAGLNDRFRLLTRGPRTSLARQRTLQASVEWSYNLLDETERSLLRRLSVFAGTFSVEAAESVCASGAADVSARLAQLIDKSLVCVDESETQARYRMLETIREYAADRLAEAGEVPEVKQRHRDFFIGFVGRRSGETDDAYFKRVEQDYHNVRRALQYSLEEREAVPLLRLAGRMWGFWVTTVYGAEGRRWLEAGLAIGDDAPAHLRARALRGAAHIGIAMGDARPMRAYAEEALALYRALDDRRGIAWTLFALVEITSTLGDDRACRESVTEAIAIARDLQDPLVLATALHFGGVYSAGTDLPAARAMLEESICVGEAAGLEFMRFQALRALGDIAHGMGRISDAQALMEESLDGLRAHGNGIQVVQALSTLASIAAGRGDHATARERLDELSVVCDQIGDAHSPLLRLLAEAGASSATGALDAAATFLLRAFELTSSPVWRVEVLGRLAGVERGRGEMSAARERVAEALALAAPDSRMEGVVRLTKALVELADEHLDACEENVHRFVELTGNSPWTSLHALYVLAVLAVRRGNMTEAGRLFGAADAVRRDLGIVVPASYREEVREATAAAEESLDPDAFRAAWTEGSETSAEDAIAYSRRGRGERRRPATGWASLTPTEREVVELVVEGLTNPQIGARLFMSRHTVKTHMSHIFAKLSVASRAELVREANARA